jgi:hypothetical protein
MLINYKNLKQALLNGILTYKKAYYIFEKNTQKYKTSFFSLHGDEGLLRAERIEKYIDCISKNEHDLLLLVKAIISNPKGTTLIEHITYQLLNAEVFDNNILQQEIAKTRSKMINHSTSSETYAGMVAEVLRINEISISISIQKLINDNLSSFKVPFDNVDQRIAAICNELNNTSKKTDDISLEPFQTELKTLSLSAKNN